MLINQASIIGITFQPLVCIEKINILLYYSHVMMHPNSTSLNDKFWVVGCPDNCSTVAPSV